MSGRFQKRAFIISGDTLDRRQWAAIIEYLKMQHGLEVTETTTNPPSDEQPLGTVSYQDMLEYAINVKHMSETAARYCVSRIWGSFIRHGQQGKYGLQFEHSLDFAAGGTIDVANANGLHLNSIAALLMRLEEELQRVGKADHLTAGAVQRIMPPNFGIDRVVFLQDFVKSKLEPAE